MTDDGHAGGACLPFGRHERAARRRLDTKDPEKIETDEGTLNSLRLRYAAEVEVAVGERGDAFEDLVLGAPIVEVSARHFVAAVRGRARLFVRLPDRDETFRFLEPERVQEDGIDHAEDRCVRTDAEREGENGDEGESGRFPKLAESEAKVVHRPEVGGQKSEVRNRICSSLVTRHSSLFLFIRREA